MFGVNPNTLNYQTGECEIKTYLVGSLYDLFCKSSQSGSTYKKTYFFQVYLSHEKRPILYRWCTRRLYAG